MRAKYERVKRVNELVMDVATDFRPTEGQEMAQQTWKENMQKPDFGGLRIMAREFEAGSATTRKTIRNFGAKAATEMMGALGIFLTQFSDDQIRTAVDLSRRRRVERMWK